MTTAVQITHETSGVGVQVEYSSMSPFSAENRWLLLFHAQGVVGLYTGNGDISRMLPSEVSTSTEPRWDRKDDDLFFFLSGNHLKQYRISARASTIVHTFTEYTKISGRGESEISLDGDHIVLCGTQGAREEVFVYEISTRKKGPVFPITAPFDGLKILPSNQALLSRSMDPPQPAVDGIWLLRDPIRQVVKRNAHAAVARYQGKDILVHVGGVAKNVNNGAVVMVDVETLSEQPLLNTDWLYAGHVSTCEKDFGLVSLAAPSNKLPAQIWKVFFDGRGAELLHEFQTTYRDYRSSPRVSLSRDGSRAVFNLDDGKAVNVWMLQVANNIGTNAVPTPPATDTKDPFAGFHKVDLKSLEGREYWEHTKIINGQRVVLEMWEK